MTNKPRIKWKDRSEEYKQGWEDGFNVARIAIYGFIAFLLLTSFLIDKCS